MPLKNQLRRKSCKGFTLIEVLIAVILLGFGLLGMAGLQAVAIKSNFEAFQRTQATTIANAAIDRMRANSTRLDEYAASDLGGQTIGTEPAGCTTADDSATCLSKLVEHDRWELEQLVDNSQALINSRVCIANNLGNVTVVIAWRGMEQRVITEQTTAALNSCGRTAIDQAFLKQVVVNTYITPRNP